MELRETIDGIMEKKNWVQEDLARFLGVKQPTVSKMRNSGDWNAHWQAFLRLLPICLELDLITEDQLLPRRTVREEEPIGKQRRAHGKQ